jgi:hypothetical protein
MLPCSAVAPYNLGIPDSANAAAASIAGTIMPGKCKGLNITYQVQAPGPFHLDFKDPNQVVLKAGHHYVFELQGECNAVSIFWRRSRSDVHLSGATYRNRQLMEERNQQTSDLAIVIYGIRKKSFSKESIIQNNDQSSDSIDYSSVTGCVVSMYD